MLTTAARKQIGSVVKFDHPNFDEIDSWVDFIEIGVVKTTKFNQNRMTYWDMAT